MAESALSQLRDLHLPVQPGWFPPAPGWWLVAVLLCAIVAACGIALWRARQRREPFRRARTELTAQFRQLEVGALSPARYADAVNAILKRIAIHALARPDAAVQSGASWLAFLDSLTREGGFQAGAGLALGDARFAPEVSIDGGALHRLLTDLLSRLERAA